MAVAVAISEIAFSDGEISYFSRRPAGHVESCSLLYSLWKYFRPALSVSVKDSDPR